MKTAYYRISFYDYAPPIGLKVTTPEILARVKELRVCHKTTLTRLKQEHLRIDLAEDFIGAMDRHVELKRRLAFFVQYAKQCDEVKQAQEHYVVARTKFMNEKWERSQEIKNMDIAARHQHETDTFERDLEILKQKVSEAKRLLLLAKRRERAYVSLLYPHLLEHLPPKGTEL